MTATGAAVAAELRKAVHHHDPKSRAGLYEAVFARFFQGLVYAQIWEDPAVDLAALEMAPGQHLAAIASGGCNILSYLSADPGRITAVDLSPAHVALNRLKIAAVTHLPDHDALWRFLGRADLASNVALYDQFIAPHLDPETLAYWNRRTLGGLGRRRISLFTKNLYRQGLLGRFIGAAHLFARLNGVDLTRLMTARSQEEQRQLFDTLVRPLFRTKLMGALTRNPLSLYGLGIPPAQHQSLGREAQGDMAEVLCRRLEKLACDFPFETNYFAWQAFARRYSPDGTGPVPPYLAPDHYARIKARAARITVQNRALTDSLSDMPAQSVDRFVLLDAQDWMTNAHLDALWHQITRTARPRARVIFRTADRPSLLPGRLDPALLSHWDYQQARSESLTRQDRSAIYGGFHLYHLREAP